MMPVFGLNLLRTFFFFTVIGIPIYSDAFMNKEFQQFLQSTYYTNYNNGNTNSNSGNGIASSVLTSLSEQHSKIHTKLFAFIQPAIGGGGGSSSSSANNIQPFNPFTSRNKNSKIRWHDDNLDIFYHYISNQPLLTAKQEFQLGRAIQFWNRLENVRESLKQKYGSKNITILDDELATYIGCNVEEIIKMKKYYEISKRRLLVSNLKLVLAVVSRYRTSSVGNSELIMQGTLGLSQAVVRYDYTRGFRFATYATWYIHQAVADYVRARKASVKLPNRHLVLLRKVKQYMTDIFQEYGKNPSVGEIAEALEIPRYEVMRVLSRRLNPIRLDEPLGKGVKDQDNEKTKTLESILPSFTTQPTDILTEDTIKDYIESILADSLTQAEKDVLKLRLGLNDGRATPLKEVGRKFKISWKQVQKLEEEAMDKLQSLELDHETSVKIINQQEALHQA